MKVLKLLLVFYCFVLSLVLIKKSAMLLGKDLIGLVSLTTPFKAFGIGWLVTSIVQSSGAVSSLVAALTGLGVLSLGIAIYFVLGSCIGSTVTSFIVSLLSKAKRRDFRHGFEIAAAHAIFNILLVIFIFPLEYFLSIFSKVGLVFSRRLDGIFLLAKIPDFVSLITGFFVKRLFFVNAVIVLIFAFGLLFFSLNFFGKVMLEIFGGEKNARNFIDRYFKSKYKGFLIGLVLTAILFSSSITISLLIPLVVSRVLNLRKAIPFILGAEVGTFTDTFLASLVIGKGLAVSVALLYLVFNIVGALFWFWNVDVLFDITKYFSKRLLKVSRTHALGFFVVFLLVPLLFLIF